MSSDSSDSKHSFLDRLIQYLIENITKIIVGSTIIIIAAIVVYLLGIGTGSEPESKTPQTTSSPINITPEPLPDSVSIPNSEFEKGTPYGEGGQITPSSNDDGSTRFNISWDPPSSDSSVTYSFHISEFPDIFDGVFQASELVFLLKTDQPSVELEIKFEYGDELVTNELITVNNSGDFQEYQINLRDLRTASDFSNVNKLTFAIEYVVGSEQGFNVYIDDVRFIFSEATPPAR